MNLKFIILIFGFKVMDCLRTQKCSRRSFVLIFALLGNLSYLNSFKTRAMLEEIGNLPANLLFQSLLETYLVSILVLMDYLFGHFVPNKRTALTNLPKIRSSIFSHGERKGMTSRLHTVLRC